MRDDFTVEFLDSENVLSPTTPDSDKIDYDVMFYTISVIFVIFNFYKLNLAIFVGCHVKI